MPVFNNMGIFYILRVITSMKTFTVFLKLLLILNLIDALATYYWVYYEVATEANPFMREWIYMGPQAFILFKIGLVSICAWSLWVYREHMLARLLCIPVFLLYFSVFLMHCAIGITVCGGAL